MNNTLRYGFSQKIDDPAFAMYIKNSNRWAGIFSLIIAVAAVTGFYIAGEKSAEMDNPESLYIGFGIGAMFLLIALYQIRGRKKGTTWDGMVTDKKTEKKRYYDKSMERWEEDLIFIVKIQQDDGKFHQIKVKNDDTLYNYYKTGDRVRHHKGLNSYEKQDKTGDDIIFCNACASLNDIQEDYCFRCKCPLLK